MSENKSVVVAAQDKEGNKALRAETSGILLHPDVVEKWGVMVPGAPREILDMAKYEQRHRVRLTYVGAFIGTVIVVGVLGTAIFMTLNGQPFAGLGVVLGPVGIIFTAAVKMGRSNKK